MAARYGTARSDSRATGHSPIHSAAQWDAWDYGAGRSDMHAPLADAVGHERYGMAGSLDQIVSTARGQQSRCHLPLLNNIVARVPSCTTTRDIALSARAPCQPAPRIDCLRLPCSSAVMRI
jgi:hypothetical protein